MLKNIASMILVLPIFFTSAFASESVADNNAVDLKFNLVSSTDKASVDPVHKIIASDLKKGVFVTVVGGWSTTFHKTSSFVKERLVSKGIKVVDKPEDAEIGLQILPISFQMDEVETGMAAGIDKEHLVSLVGTAIFTGGISLLGETWRKSASTGGGQVILDARFFKNPKISSRGKLSSESDDVEIVSTLVYSANKSGPDVSTAAFAAYVEKLIENNFVLDAEHSSAAKTATDVQAQTVAAANQ